jgi:uncharacterized protein (TIGR03067 family)
MTSIAIACSLIALSQVDPAKELEGSYDLKQIYEEGKFSPQDVMRIYQEVTIANGELTLRSTAGIDTAKFTIDAKAKIPQIDFTSTKPGETKTALGIYKLEKGELTIVFHKGGTRPTDFKGDGKDMVKLVMVKRVPKKEVPKK